MLQPGQRFKLTRYTVDSILGSQVPTCTQASTESNQLRIQKSHSGLITIYELQAGVYAASCVLLAGFLCRIAFHRMLHMIPSMMRQEKADKGYVSTGRI